MSDAETSQRVAALEQKVEALLCYAQRRVPLNATNEDRLEAVKRWIDAQFPGCFLATGKGDFQDSP